MELTIHGVGDAPVPHLLIAITWNGGAKNWIHFSGIDPLQP